MLRRLPLAPPRLRRADFARGLAKSARRPRPKDPFKNIRRIEVCAGCGVDLASAADTSSAVAPRAPTLFPHAASRELCSRCEALREGSVHSVWDAMADVHPDVFKEQLKFISRGRMGLCLKVVDGTDFEGTRTHTILALTSYGNPRPHAAGTCVPSLREVIRGTPTILVINKCDLLPRLDMHDLRYLQRRLERRGVSNSAIYSAIYSAVHSARIHVLTRQCIRRFTRRFTRRFRA